VRRRQQEYLEKSVEGLKRKVQTTTDVHRADTVRFRQARVLQPCYRCGCFVNAVHTCTLRHLCRAATGQPCTERYCKPDVCACCTWALQTQAADIAAPSCHMAPPVAGARPELCPPRRSTALLCDSSR